VAIVDEARVGGTCVINGCVPKKLLVYASKYSEHFADAAASGCHTAPARFDWSELLAAKNREIARLEGFYRAGLEKAGATVIHGRGRIVGRGAVQVDGGRVLRADVILVATGSRTDSFPSLPGNELCIGSTEALNLTRLPCVLSTPGSGRRPPGPTTGPSLPPYSHSPRLALSA
jgi:glutathione reductase (NADPH)